MLRLKQHRNRKFDGRTWWNCPTCNYKDVAITTYPEQCECCRQFLPSIGGLLTRATARAAYHFAERYQK